MKKLYILLPFFFLLFNAKIIAQKKLSEGSFSYKISIAGLNGEPSPGLSGATLHVYLKPTLSRTDMVSSLGSETNIYDSKAGKGFMLREYSGQKLMITMSKDNWNQKTQVYDNLIFKVEDGFTQIAGQNCKKAITTLQNGKPFIVFFNPDIDVLNKEYSNAFTNLPGLPVQYEMVSGNLSFKYTLNNVLWDPVASSKFESPKTGFRVMSYDENQQLKKGE
ncbi:MAG: hypothetical protein ABIW38_02945 [Ferruginibacter sp.]